MSYLSDYLFYNSGNECPTAYHTWSALSALSTVVSRKVWLERNYFRIYPNIYVLLVGDAGSGKNTAKDCVVFKILLEHFPMVPICASVTSREDVAKFMGGEDCLRSFKLPDGAIEEFRPFFFAVNEFDGLLSVDIKKMTGFLVDLFDSRSFSTSFKRDATKDKIPNPCATLLAGCVPDWLMRTLKIDLFSGGLGRRLIIIYESKTILNAHPTVPIGGDEAWARVIAHLRAIEPLTGPMSLSPEADRWWTSWYEDPKRLKTDDPILAQFFATKHVQLQKIAILLALADYSVSMTIKPEHFEMALAMMDVLEPNIKKLSSGIGRNELASVAMQVIDTLKFHDGKMSLKALQRRFFRDCKLNGKEFDGLIEHLNRTDQIVTLTSMNNGCNGEVCFLPEEYKKWKEGQKG